MNVPRPAESGLRRVLTGSADLFRGDDYPRRLAEAAAGSQLPVTTGRRIAVVGSRGGAGRTTSAALLARIYAAMRADAVAAVDNAPESGTLGFRLGVPDAPSLEAVAARMDADPPATMAQLAGLLAVAGPANLLVTGRRSPHARAGAGVGTSVAGSTAAGTTAPAWTPAGPLARNLSGGQDDGGVFDGVSSGAPGIPSRRVSEGTGQVAADAAASLLSRIVSRYCPITVFDCGAGLRAPAARWALESSHLALFVTPASAAGVADAVEYSAGWHLDPLLGSVPLLVLVVQCTRDGALSASRQAAGLRRAGIDAAHVSYDRHLAAGTAVSPALLARRTRLEAVSLASRVLSLAVSGPGPGPRRSGSAGSAGSAGFAQARRTPA
ncbi:hypothetical protein [Arthrobacter sp. 08Y14]|uniref:hypothetical protein n=1 Tax=Arthrobacter sp. 08Y14 TaxID=2058885 RepID=UPI000CE3307B|nr:hypothetical protein [Arthrobacter sp. 08Y14]